jgi:penicillin-binding protein 2
MAAQRLFAHGRVMDALTGFGGRGLHMDQGALSRIATLAVLLLSILFAGDASALAATVKTPPAKPKTSSVTDSENTQSQINAMKHSRPTRRRRVRGRLHHRRYYERFYTSSFADDVTAGDVSAGEDPIVRQAAVDALGNMNGTVVAIDPASGRILTMVNQKLALSEGAQPCSTIKLAVALAALHEGLIDKDTEIRLGRRSTMTLTEAIAHSNNPFFEELGRKMGFKKVSSYAHEYGLGEIAGYDIPGEQLGEFPTAAPSNRDGGVGKMCSYGEDISMTPLQLGALVSAMANGGTLYYLQHPRDTQAVSDFKPLVKRQLEFESLLPEMRDGLLGATQYGTAKSVRYNFNEEEVLGKTGTCSKDGTRFGWFASYADTDHGKIALVIFLRGGRPTFGPKAAEIAGRIYRSLYDQSYFAEKTVRDNPALGASQ